MENYRPFKISFFFDGSGIGISARRSDHQIHLDALMTDMLCPLYIDAIQYDSLGQRDKPVEMPLPLMRWEKDDAWGWHASALFFEGLSFETLHFWRKRFRENRLMHTTGTINTSSGALKNYNVPFLLVLSRKMVAYAYGDMRKTKEILGRIKYIGHKRSIGKGFVNGIELEEIDEDFSLVIGGKAQRYLPHENGSRIVRTRPPYWNIVDRVSCCNVGDDYAF